MTTLDSIQDERFTINGISGVCKKAPLRKSFSLLPPTPDDRILVVIFNEDGNVSGHRRIPPSRPVTIIKD